jgi:transcriptional regulator with GAF, ATPase, and Fis domain
MMKRFTIRIQDRDGFERRIPLGNVTVLGRQKQCDVVLSDEMVSRLHLRVECLDGKCWVEDLGSSHGTYQDGARIKRIPWEQGTVLIIADGAYKLMLVQERAQLHQPSAIAIISTAQHLIGEFGLDQVLQKSLDHLLLLSGQDRGFIMLATGRGGNVLEIRAHRNLSPDIDDRAELSMSSVSQVFETGEAIWVSDISTTEALINQHSVIDLQIKMILCLPLSVKDKRIGVVYLDSSQIKPDPIDRSTFEAIVELCAIAIERAQLAEESGQNSHTGAAPAGVARSFKEALFSIGSHAERLLACCDSPEAKRHAEQIQSLLSRLEQIGSKMVRGESQKPLGKSSRSRVQHQGGQP